MRWFCLICFIAGVFVVIGFCFMVGVAFAMHQVNHRSLPFFTLFLAFLVYVTALMFKGYRQRD